MLGLAPVLSKSAEYRCDDVVEVPDEQDFDKRGQQHVEEAAQGRGYGIVLDEDCGGSRSVLEQVAVGE